MTRGLGCRPDDQAGLRTTSEPQNRYGGFRAVSADASGARSFRSLVPDVLDQGHLGSCCAQALTRAWQLCHALKRASAPELGSRLWLYYCARRQVGEEQIDQGTELVTCIRIVNAMGLPPEREWPHDLTTWARMPATSTFMRAYQARQTLVARRISCSPGLRAQQVRAAIADAQPVVMGLPVDQPFLDGAFDPLVPLGAPDSSQLVGGHAMVAAGYRADGSIELLNSWGTGWGDGGWCLAGQAFLAAAQDLWAISTR